MSKDDFGIGTFEEIVLLALVRLRDNAYGMSIRQEIEKRSGREVSIGAVYTTLDRLEQKGLVSSQMGEATPERGGRAKRYFKIQAPGKTALERTRKIMDRMWQGLKPAGA
jgi:DNA-binding PadR family transcriptional regulator